MSVMKFAIDKVLPNPYQTRLSEDSDHVRDLAKSIYGRGGIMQNPVGRMSTAEPGKVEIAFGHTRLAALKYLTSTCQEELAGLEIAFTTPDQYQTFLAAYSKIDIDIRNLTDQEMFEMAVTENHDRKDLNPIEEAKAMAVYRDTFNKNSDEIGLLFHISGSAVRNKLRLLDLPEEYKPLISNGEVTEGMARELLTLKQLPKEWKEEHSWYENNNCTVEEKLKKQLQKGELDGENLKAAIDDLYRYNSTVMDSKTWKNAEELLDTQGQPLSICKGCPHFVIRNKHELCTNKACFTSKTIAWKTNYLKQASLVSGIPVLEHDDDRFKSHTQFAWGSETTLQSIREKGGCLNLRLTYSEANNYRGESNLITNLVKEGYPNAMIVCSKKEGFCTCIRAVKSGVEEEKTESNEQKTEADLKRIRKQISDQKKINDSLITALVEQATNTLYLGLMNHNYKAMLHIIANGSRCGFSDYDSDIKNIADLDSLYYKVSQLVAEHSSSREANSPQTTLRYLNGILEHCGLETLAKIPESTIDEDQTEPVVDEQETVEPEEKEELEYVDEFSLDEDARASLDEVLTDMNPF